ncbi:hypothetical protein J1N35_010553 [Gossypium stocksii]|uniref:Uncharacterized protein n=1 Tax=Gossypium stocksii TaxID=47602 RepID=A0A9D4ACN8_9ROSI|nr:hypothetical protein J1N35_010553 [Gossypium stocksii]
MDSSRYHHFGRRFTSAYESSNGGKGVRLLLRLKENSLPIIEMVMELFFASKLQQHRGDQFLGQSLNERRDNFIDHHSSSTVHGTEAESFDRKTQRR